MHTPPPRSLYACTTKLERGEFLLFIKEDDTHFEFQQLPDLHLILLTKKDFDLAINTKILDFIEQLPEEVHAVSIANIKT